LGDPVPEARQRAEDVEAASDDANGRAHAASRTMPTAASTVSRPRMPVDTPTISGGPPGPDIAVRGTAATRSAAAHTASRMTVDFFVGGMGLSFASAEPMKRTVEA
jgi:hypothetical protein